MTGKISHESQASKDSILDQMSMNLAEDKKAKC